MKCKLTLIAFILCGTFMSSSAATICKGFLPPNDLNIPVGSAEDRGMLQEQFNSVLDSIETLYAPIIAARGGVLEIRRLWTDGTVNASTTRQGNRYILNMYGGLARHEAVTMDGFALVVCHELGHHLGGMPKKPYSSWATNEGQADYYANLKCLKQVFAEPESASFTRSTAGDEVARKGCEQQFPDPQGRALCLRSALAGKSVAALFMALHQDQVEPRFDTPDPKVVSTMFDSHPATQCRLDTYLQGSLCTQPVSAEFSDTDPVAGACTRAGGFSTGLRPLCWYKPFPVEQFVPSMSGFADILGRRGLSGPGSALSVLQSDNPWQGF